MQKRKLLIIAIVGALMSITLSVHAFADSTSMMEIPESVEMISAIPYPTDMVP